MTLACAFKTTTREQFGFLYLGLIKSIDPRFFINPKWRPLLSMVGDTGKSYAADIMFHHLLDGLDPIDVIKGQEARQMYLEDWPCHAVQEKLYAHGTITHGGAEYPASLMFSNEADLGINVRNCVDPYRMENESTKDLLIAAALSREFSEHATPDAGGLMFASSLFSSASTLNIHVHEGQPWDCVHEVYAQSAVLTRDPMFQQGWENMVTHYGCA